MAFDFPNAPTVGQAFQGYTWDGEKWIASAGVASQAGALSIQFFPATAVYVPSPNMTTAIVEVRGSGGGGGAANQGIAGSGAAGGGGGQGSLSRSVLTAAQIGASQPVTIGNAGVGGIAGTNNGTAGQDCSFGALVIGKGGSFGTYGDASIQNGAAGSGGPVGTGQFTEPGFSGGAGCQSTVQTTVIIGGFGGGQGGGIPFANVNGTSATGFGAGGAGGSRTSSSTGSSAGGNGSKGYCCVTEFGLMTVGGAAAQGVRRGWIAGLTLSAAGATAVFGIAPGEAADSTNSVLMQLTAAFTKTTAVWAVGSGNGALDTGVIGAASWYHVFLIRRPDTGLIDVLVSLSPTAPTLPAGYTQFRRIGSMKTAASQWLAFTQVGEDFQLGIGVTEFSGAALGTAPTLFVLGGVPTGVQVWANIRVAMINASAAYYTVASPDETISAPGVLNSNVLNPVATGAGVAQLSIRTNTAAQIRAVAGQASSSMYLSTFGWTDRRGRDA
jgi:hypothetical protein